MKITKDFYNKDYFEGKNKIAYDSYQQAGGLLNTFATWTNELFKPASVLDVGCAYGFVVKRFQDLGIPATGIEYSPYAVSQAVCQNVFGGDVRDLSRFKNNSFDLVLGTELLEHIPEDDVFKAVKELYRVSKHFVFLLICTANSDHIESRGGKGDPSHITLKPRWWWESLFHRLDIKRDFKKEDFANNHQQSRQMKWAGRFFVLSKE
ncbi:MAG: class I SAM-dependent methyltransferase [Candidatus Daviesbacteria bacterium]|nr:class I SAM-dependent methyltransferase [Candidatus Daviesbacteria bacterium]